MKSENKKEDRKDRRLAEEQTGKRQIVVVARERGGRTLPFIFRKGSEVVDTIRARVEPGSVIHADEASSWESPHVRSRRAASRTLPTATTSSRRGLSKIDWQFTFAMAAYNLIRLPKLLAVVA